MFPRMHLTINGGIQDIGEIKTHLSNGIDGVYDWPFSIS